MAESLYLTNATGRSIALAAQLLDTTCSTPTCVSLEKRWGLDSLWWGRDDRAVAIALKSSLLAQAGQNLAFGPNGIGNRRIVSIGAGTIPGPMADSAAWRAFLTANGAVAAIRFSPAGFSSDGKRALVVVRMTCGPLCGHWMGASLVQKDGAWSIADLLLIASDRPSAVRRLPNQAAEAVAAFGGIMMGTFKSRRSLAAIR